MEHRLPWSYLWSKQFLGSRFMLWTLLIINFAGTLYGYQWYMSQMEWTAAHKPLWMLLFVPDSPTASLFFTLTIVYLILDKSSGPSLIGSSRSKLRQLVETLAAVTSIKYGIWAVAMIGAGAAWGDELAWQDGMLVISHLGMALEALLFIRWYKISLATLIITALWVFGNDFVDYRFNVYPWLPDALDERLTSVMVFTVFMSLASLLVVAIYRQRLKEVKV